MRIRMIAIGWVMSLLVSSSLLAEDKPIVGIIPKATRAITLDGKLDDWEGAFSTQVHIGHPNYLNRGAEFYYLWDQENLYIGLKCLDQHPAHTGRDDQIWNGDAVEFYLDTRRGDEFGKVEWTPGALHMFYTPFTNREMTPRLQVRDMPHQKDFVLKGAELATQKTDWGWSAEFKLPWKHFPKFTPKSGETIGLECELCSSDGTTRVDRTFVYSGPAAVGTPSAFGRIKLVDSLVKEELKQVGAVLLPTSITKSANYDWMYGEIGLSSGIAKQAAKIEGKLIDKNGKAIKNSVGKMTSVEGIGHKKVALEWELFDVAPGIYTLELSARDPKNQIVTTRSIPILHKSVPK